MGGRVYAQRDWPLEIAFGARIGLRAAIGHFSGKKSLKAGLAVDEIHWWSSRFDIEATTLFFSTALSERN
jgi:hypothetical protein